MSIRTFNVPAMRAEEKRDMIAACLRDTRCAMTADQIRDWLRDNRRATITEAEIRRQLGIHVTEGRAEPAGPGNTTQFKAARPGGNHGTGKA